MTKLDLTGAEAHAAFLLNKAQGDQLAADELDPSGYTTDNATDVKAGLEFAADTATQSANVIAMLVNRIRELERASQTGSGEAATARFEVRVDGNIAAGAEGCEANALREATHYFYQYVDEADTEIELVQVSRVLYIDRDAARAALGGGDSGEKK